VWDVVEEEYQKPPVVIIKYQKMEFTCNVKSMNSMLSSLPELELIKVMDNITTKGIWDNMSSYYEGENKIKQYKLQGLRI